MPGWLRCLIAMSVCGGAGCGGCAWETGPVEQEELGLVLRTGPGCARGCAVDRPFMVGTEERIELVGNTVADVVVRSTNPHVAVAWLEESALCCMRGTCHVLDPASPCTEAQRSEMPTIVVRGLASGRTRLLVERSNGTIAGEVGIHVAHPARVVAIPGARELPTSGSEPGSVLEPALPAMGRPVTSLTLQMGTARTIRLEVFDAREDRIFSSSGVGIRVVHPEIAVLTPEDELALETGVRSLSEDHALIVPRRIGQTSLVVAAGSATASISISVIPAGPTAQLEAPAGAPDPLPLM